MEIPNSVTVNTGEQEEVHRTIERFFDETIREVKKRYNIQESPTNSFKIDVRNLCYFSENTRQSDNFAHMLFYRESVIAVVLETRTEMNYMHFDYFLNIPKIL